MSQVDPDGDGTPNPQSKFNGAARLSFVSSRTYTGNFSGFIDAAEECADMAFNASLPGWFMPWVSDDAELAPDKLENLTANPLIPYVTMAGTVVADNRFDFVNGGLVSPINVDENGDAVPDSPVWTGTDSVGDNIGTNCLGFNSSAGGNQGAAGSTAHADSGWTDDILLACDQLARIYCIEVDHQP